MMMNATAPHKWQRRVALREHSIAQQEVYYSRHMTPANAAYDAARNDARRKAAFAWVQKAEDEFARYVDRSHLALRLVMLTPAPDLSALARKLELAVAEDIQDYGHEGAEFIAAMRDDAQRLLGKVEGESA